MTDEYHEIMTLRVLWSKAIMTWTQIFIPLTIGIFAFSITQYPNFYDKGWGFQYLIFIGIIYFITVVFFRAIVHSTDKSIVAMYPRLLELEKKDDMTLFSSYYYRNIKQDYRNELFEKLGLKYSESWDYRKFREEAEKRGKNPHDMLLEIWDKNKIHSVTSRGHGMVDGFLIGIGTAYFVIIALLWYVG